MRGFMRFVRSSRLLTVGAIAFIITGRGAGGVRAATGWVSAFRGSRPACTRSPRSPG